MPWRLISPTQPVLKCKGQVFIVCDNKTKLVIILSPKWDEHISVPTATEESQRIQQFHKALASTLCLKMNNTESRNLITFDEFNNI